MAGRHIERCLDCGRAHGELEALGDCSGAVDSRSTLYCPRCLEPIPHVTPAQILKGWSGHECPSKETSMPSPAPTEAHHRTARQLIHDLAKTGGDVAVGIAQTIADAESRAKKPPEHVVTCCEDCVAENQGTCLLDGRELKAFRRENADGARACPNWCPLRSGAMLLRLEPDEETP